MANLGMTFKRDEMPENDRSYDPIPAGWYNAIIASTELRSTKSGTGQYISVRYDVTGPSHQGRVIFDNLNVFNPNAKAEEIGRRQLGEIMRAIGLSDMQDSDQLVGGDLCIKVAIESSAEYGDKNVVKGFRSVNGSAPPAPSAKPAPTASAPAQKRAAPPWQK